MKKSILKGFENRFPTDNKKNKSAVANGFLLFFTILTVFVIPVFPGAYLNLLFSIAITGIFFFAVLSLKNDKNSFISISVFLTLALWAAFFSKFQVVNIIFRTLNFFFFIFLVISLIKQVSSTATVTVKVIVDAITGYLLLGFAYSLIVAIISTKIPGAYNMNFSANIDKDILEPMQDNIYYTFMTFTTTGYGDIVPTHPVSQSLAVLISVSGQLYVAVIIAMLVGKYASNIKSK
nr:ion channel [uncultured Flavobacterium sp.]